MSKRIRIYTAEDVAEHNTRASCWVSRGRKVYDVSKFLADHPGGDDLIMRQAGAPIDGVLEDTKEHEHSDSAYDMLEEYLVGRLGTEETLLRDDWEATDDFKPETTDLAEDLRKTEFLDLNKPLVYQIWDSHFSKSYYLKQVHQPRHLARTARLFENNLLEITTRAEWYFVPLIWLPISAYLFLRSLFQFTGPLPSFWTNPVLPLSAISQVPNEAVAKSVLCFFLGNILWTFFEYAMHRFLFHIDKFMPDRPIFLALHFFFHGVHHYLPMDRLRLMMPPILFTTLQFPFTQLAYAVFPVAVANGIVSGAFAFYVLYESVHYALHHSMLPFYMREMKKYHLAHHYKNWELGFGVTSKIWDYVFGSVLSI
ncbi:hypothetical protein HGRIS_000316 [Hohenbuehelia grisea]|uniref:Ceramide very long chain fatty acid hydroxylase n=1 Tax=Hohenbuehelia grisea TaxID=104357 RepID=A0ABR3JRA5_9AGAR